MTSYYHNPIKNHRTFSVYFIKFFSLVFPAALLLLTGSCEEKGNIIGKDVLPEGDFVSIHSTDTITVVSYTEYTDAIPSVNPSISYLGQLYDPYFGTTSAEFVSQIRLGEEWAYDLITIDSVQLILTFNDVSGYTAGGHYLQIAEIDKHIYVDSTYYSNVPVPLTGYSIPEIPLPALKADSVNVIVLDLPVSVGNYLTRNPSMLFHSNAVPDFRSFFKGFKFTLRSTVEPAFLTLGLASPGFYGISKNYFIIYFHDQAGVSYVFPFIIDAKTNNARFNIFSHKFSDAKPGKIIQHINDRVRDTLSFLQSLSGVSTKIEIPGLADIKNDPSFSNVSVNKARIICPVWYDREIYKPSTFPSQLFMRYFYSDGSRYLMPDYYLNSSFFDGAIDTVKNVYNFNIASYVQSYLEDTRGDFKPEFELVLPAGITTNAILRSNSNSVPVRFEFTYTKF